MIISETSLSFLGLGLRPPAISWGVLLQDAQNIQALVISPWLLIPSLAVIVTVLAFNFLGDGLRDAADPYQDKASQYDGDERVHRNWLRRRPGTARRDAQERRTTSRCPRCRYRNLKTDSVLPGRGTTVKAVDGASFDLYPGKTLGIVGESGCGKSVTAQSILRIVDQPGRIVGRRDHPAPQRRRHATIDLAELKPDSREMRAIRGSEIGLIFQEPMTSFSPVHTIGNQIIEAIRLHARGRASTRRGERGIEVLRSVGIPKPGAAHRRVPVRAQRRPAPARDDRHGPVLRPAPAHRRRADDGPGRDDPGADSGPAAQAAAASSGWPSCSSRTTWAWSRRWPTRWW